MQVQTHMHCQVNKINIAQHVMKHKDSLIPWSTNQNENDAEYIHNIIAKRLFEYILVFFAPSRAVG